MPPKTTRVLSSWLSAEWKYRAVGASSGDGEASFSQTKVSRSKTYMSEVIRRAETRRPPCKIVVRVLAEECDWGTDEEVHLVADHRGGRSDELWWDMSFCLSSECSEVGYRVHRWHTVRRKGKAARGERRWSWMR